MIPFLLTHLTSKLNNQLYIFSCVFLLCCFYIYSFFFFLNIADFPQPVCTTLLKPSDVCVLLISFSCAVANESSDNTADQKADYRQHSSEPHWHSFLCFDQGEAVDLRKDVRMLLKGKKHNRMTSSNLKTFLCPRNQMQVSSDVWDVFRYLSGAPDGVSAVCEKVVCLFLPYWLQLGLKQRTLLACRPLVKQARTLQFISPHSPCYSTELQPWWSVRARWNGNSPPRRRWCPGRHPEEKTLVRVRTSGWVANWFARGPCRKARTAFNGRMVFLKKGCATAAKSSLPS